MKTKEIETMPINQELLNLIAPQGIEIKSSRVQMGEFLSKIQYISGYPSRVNIGWLLSLKDIPNTVVSLTVIPIEDIQGFVEGVSKGITTDKNIYNTTQNEFLKTQAEYKIASAETMIREITIDNIPYINLSFLAKTNGNTENNFTENMRIVKNKIASMGLKARLPAFQQELALKQASPYDISYGEITDISNKQMSLAALFKGLPFSGSGIIDEKGYYLGTDEDGRTIILDTFIKSPDRPNSNITISGASGSGKSYLAKKIMLNEWLIGKTAFSLFSFKIKMIIIGIAVGIFIVIIFPVVAIMSAFFNDDTQTNQRQGGGSDSNTIVNEVIAPESLKKYIDAKFPMPFETWNSEKDIVTSKFSPSRTITVNGQTQTRAHTGIDLVVISIDNPKICAVLEGKVVVARAGNTGYGNYVVIRHTLEDNSTIYILYGHMKQGSLMVAEGMEIQTGQVLGIMGNTGNSTGSHLHFEIRVGENSSNKTVDPYSYLFGD